MGASNWAPDNDGSGANYQLGDIPIARNRSDREPSGVSRSSPPNAALDEGPVQLPSVGRTGPRNLTLVDDEQGEGPSLELDVELPHPSRSPGRSQVTASRAALDGFGGRQLGDELDADAHAPGANLDVEGVTAGQTRVAADPARPAQPSPAEQYAALVALGGFGASPRSLLASLPYAVRAAFRLYALRGERKRAWTEAKKADESAAAALVDMGRAFVQMGNDPRLAPLRTALATAVDARGKMEGLESEAAKARQSREQALLALDADIAREERALAPYRAREDEALAEQKKADADLRRASAMLRRVEIELRALAEAATADAQREATLEAQRKQREDMVVAQQRALDRANEALGAARRELSLQRGGLDALAEKKRGVQRAAQVQEQVLAKHGEDASAGYAASLGALAEDARDRGLGALVPTQERAVVAALGVRSEAYEHIERFERAMQMVDRDAVTRGAFVAAALAAALVAAIALH